MFALLVIFSGFALFSFSQYLRYSRRLWRKIVCLVVFSVVNISPNLYAQQRNSFGLSGTGSGYHIKFEHFSPGRGLSQNTITCILQDRKGFLWFGTEDGLMKYDGYTFTVYRSDPKNPYSLSDDVIQALYEDHSGVLWIGTRGGGLNTFDREMEQFFHYQTDSTNPHSLSYNTVSAIYEDRSEVLWIGTSGGGLNRFDRGTDRFFHYRHDDRNSNSLSSNFIRSIYEDRAGNLWIGTLGGGLNRFERKTESFFRYQVDRNNPSSLSHNAVWAIHEDSSGTLWIGTYGGGLNKFDRKTERFFSYQADPYNPYSLSHNKIQTIYADRAGTLWIGTEGGGLNRFDRETERFFHYQTTPDDPSSLSHNIVRSIYEDRAGVIWIGTEGGGLNKFTNESEKFYHYQLAFDASTPQVSNVVMSIYEDQAGALWIGTYGGGLTKFDRKAGQFTHYQHDPNHSYSLSSSVVFSIYQDRSGMLWVGTKDGGLNTLIPSSGSGQALSKAEEVISQVNQQETEQFSHYQHDPHDPHSLSHNRVRVIYEDRNGILWIGTEGGGLNRFDPQVNQGERKHFVRYQHDPNDPSSLSHDAVWAIYEDHLGELWIGTDNGLDRFHRETEQFLHYQADPTNPSSLSHNNIRVIYEDRLGVLWIGTRGGGLNRFHRSNETFTHYEEKDGLPGNVIYGILEDHQGNLWLSTNKYGVSKFNPQTESYKNFDVHDGLQSNSFTMGAYHKSRSGEMFFGGINGFNAFYPNNILDNPHIPPVVITDFQIFHESVNVNDEKIHHDSPLRKSITEAEEIELSYKNTVISFEFAALDYTVPEKNQYAYMLEGVDKDWVEAGTQRFVTYTDVKPGEYVFRLKGSNNDGVWNQEGTSVKIIIIPPFWKTWGFRILIAVLVVGGTLGVFYGRVRTINTQKRQLEIQVNERTEDLKKANEQLRQEIAEREQMEIDLQHAKEIAEESQRIALEAKDVAESANRAKSEFLANMSHELRTPLNAILGYAQIFAHDESFTPKQREAVNIVHRSGEHLLSMINDILDLSKIEARKIQLEPTDLHLPEFLNSLADMVRLQANHKGISFTSDIAPNVPTVIYSDEKRLRQILLNLLSNAVKFTEKGGVIFRIWNLGFRLAETKSVKHKSEPGICRIRFQVEDTGPGILFEDMNNIFQPFQQVGDKQLHSEGTGLGLTISQNLVRLMGSELHVKSTPNQGSTFWFDVYFPEVVEREIFPVKTETNYRKIVGFSGEPRKILIVDDNDENRAVMKDMLSPLGFEIIEAIDGRDALDKTKTCSPDLIVMDLMMPVLDGIEAAGRIRQIPALNDVIIIGMSANVFPRTQQKSITAGCNGFIVKPVDLENLLECLHVHLKLEWIYEDKPVTQEMAVYSKRQPLILPPKEELLVLYGLAKSGDIAGLRRQISRVAELDPKFGPFIAKLTQLAKEFRINEIKRYLEAYVSGNYTEGSK